MSKCGIIDQVYSSIYIARSIVICKNQGQVEAIKAELAAKDYPVSGTRVDMIKMLVMTLADFQTHPYLLLDKTSVVFTLDLEAIGTLAQSPVPLIVAI